MWCLKCGQGSRNFQKSLGEESYKGTSGNKSIRRAGVSEKGATTGCAGREESVAGLGERKGVDSPLPRTRAVVLPETMTLFLTFGTKFQHAHSISMGTGLVSPTSPEQQRPQLEMVKEAHAPHSCQ